MKTVRLLLGNSQARVSNLIETLVRSVCADQAVVETTRTAQAGDFTRLGCEEEFDLIIVLPDNLLPDPSPQGSLGPFGESVRAIAAIRQQCPAPIIAISASPQSESALMEAGVDCVLELPFKCEQVKAAVQQALTLSPPAEQPSKSRGSLAAALMRGFQRLTQN